MSRPFLPLRAGALAAALLLFIQPLRAEEVLRLGYLGLVAKREAPQPFLDPPPEDEGLQGARLGIADDNTTGRFTNQNFVLDEAPVPEGGDVAAGLKKLLDAGDRFIVTNLPEESLLAAASLPEAKDVTFFNAASADDELRAGKCRRNLLHTMPSRAMLADALVQYLVAKQWRNVFLAVGPTEADRAYAAAVKHSIEKFRAKLAAEKPWNWAPGAKRSDTGHYAVAAEVARFTQGVSYDVLVVADEEDEFGDYLSYATFDPRPVAGTQGLVPAAWARAHQQWGAPQVQNRFLAQAKRWMTGRDYAAWLAARAVGEAATRTRSLDPATLLAYMRGDKFELAGYKGVPLSFRPWDGQMRQAILLAQPRALVSVSPQPGYLHQFSELDTLGVDRPESKCRFE